MAIRAVGDGGPRVNASPTSERVPPHNLEAEESVLGAMLISKDAIAEVLEQLADEDFYRPAHRTVFRAVLDLYARGEAVDVITVVEHLRRAGTLEDIGGALFVHSLSEGVPTAANAGHYARIVKETGTLRRLIDAGTRIVQLGFETPQETERAVDLAEQLVYQVAQGRVTDDYHALREVLTATLEEIERLHDDHREITGVPTGFPDLDRLTSGLQPSNMVILAARPAMGKSTLGLDVARHAAVKANTPAVIFSLEMSRTELVQRLMCAECSVDMQRLRTGRLEENDWARLTRSLGKLADAPLFIDDSANTTLMEIRAKCRRLKQRNGLGLVVVDYLQLMQPAKRSENRQQEVSEMSRGLKLLAKELEIPVIAISQLSRQTEARSDRRPMLSDLRESGCLTADTRVLRADTGAEVSMGELLLRGEKDIPVWTLGEDLRLTQGTMTHVFPSGIKEVFELRLASGRRVKASANHPFRTLEGWKPLEELRVGSRIAVPRIQPEPTETTPWPEAEVIMLAHLIGDGCVAPRQPIHYTSADPANIAAVEDAAEHFGITPRHVRQENWWHVYLPSPHRTTHGKRNPIAAWLDRFGLYALRSYEKFIPREVFALPNRQLALFLRHLWATDGSVVVDEKGCRLYYASTSQRLVDDVQSLLLRFGIHARAGQARKKGYRPNYYLYVRSAENQLAFLNRIGVHGARGRILETARDHLMKVRRYPYVDSIPVEIWAVTDQLLKERAWSRQRLMAEIGASKDRARVYTYPPGRARLSAAADVLESSMLRDIAESDVLWDRIIGIETKGEEPVYDATVPGTHNFIADGIIGHNSLEQDSDMVILLYREDTYDQDSSRKGEADFIVAKHRNGPTDTVTVTFQGQYSRFTPMAARSL